MYLRHLRAVKSFLRPYVLKGKVEVINYVPEFQKIFMLLKRNETYALN